MHVAADASATGARAARRAAPRSSTCPRRRRVGGGIALLRTGDRLRIDLNAKRVDVLLSDEELAARRAAWQPPKLVNQTPWQEISRHYVGQLAEGGCLELQSQYSDIITKFGEARHNH